MSQAGRNSSWDRLQRLPEQYRQQVYSIYGEHMPLDVRKVLSDWVDKVDWSILDLDNPTMTQYIIAVANQLIAELEDKTSKSNDTITRIKLSEALVKFRQSLSTDPSFMLRILRDCMMHEQEIVIIGESSLGLNLNPDRTLIIQKTLEDSRSNIQRLEEQYSHMEKFGGTFVFNYQELQKTNAQLQRMQASGQATDSTQHEIRQLENLIKENARELDQLRRNFVESVTESVRFLGHVEQQILSQELPNWHRAQQLSGNGHPNDINFERLQECCETLTEHIYVHLQLLEKLKYQVVKLPTASEAAFKETFDIMETQLKTLLSALVSGTFIIEKQPPQVMKTNTRFTATVRLLVGAKLKELFEKNPSDPPQVRVSIISEAQASALARNNGYPSTEVAGELSNNMGAIEHHHSSRQYSASFRNMSLKKIRRADKKGTESVMDEKFCLVFQSNIKIADMTFHVQAQSLPVVVIVHGNQEPHAWATITWDNAFSEPKRLPFTVPDSVTWNKMAYVLSTKFSSATGRGLSDSNLHFLATKVFHNPNLPPDYGSLVVTWNQFCKEPLHDRNFTFWEWFYAIMKLTREHLRAIWMDGLIWGFISRPETEDKLLKGVNGTFLLRFSDSEPGGVSIAWIAETENNQKQIYMVHPFTAKDFQIRSLGDRISDLGNLVYLYPNVPKDQAFCKYYTTLQQNHSHGTNGYVRPQLVTQIEVRQLHAADSNPPTPLPFYNHPESNIFAAGPEGSFGDPNMQIYDLNPGNQTTKRQRVESFCTLQQPNWPEVADRVDNGVHEQT